MASVKIYDTSARKFPALEELIELGRYRFLVFQLVRRDILSRYKRSVLGVAWTMLNPMATMLILSIVFSKAFNAGPDYASYVLSGLIAWLFFSQTTNSAIAQLVWGEGLFKRIYLPKTVFTVSSIGVGFVNLTLSIVPLLLVMLVTKVPIQWTILFLPIPILFLGLFALGVALLISTFAIYFIDVAEMYQVVLLAWMYLSPVLYPKEYIANFPQFGIWIARINPMYHLLNLFRMPLLEGKIPDLDQVLITGGISLVFAILGWLIFTSKADEMSYRL